MYEYRVTILRVIDGDTVDVRLDLGFRIYHDLRTRMARINAFELNAKDEPTRALAVQGRDFVAISLPVGDTFTVHSSKPYADDKYGRWVVEFFLADSSSLSNLMLTKGLAVTYGS